MLKKGEQAQQQWANNACHDLKHKRNGAQYIVRELKCWLKKNGNTSQETNSKTITYFENNLKRMNYPLYQKMGYTIGSGVTEVPSKTVVKQRLSQSGMRWNLDNTQGMLFTRALVATHGRWEEFWKF